MSFQQLVSSFQELAEEIPQQAVCALMSEHLSNEYSRIFRETPLPDFCSFLLDNLADKRPIVGLAVALNQLNNQLSLHSGQYLPVNEIETIFLQFGILRSGDNKELLTAEGSPKALLQFGNSTFLLYAGHIFTEFEGRRFSQCNSVMIAPDFACTGVFKFEESFLPVIASKIITEIGSIKIDEFYGKVLEDQCFGCIRSGSKFYLIDRGQIVQELNCYVEKCDVCLDPEGLMEAIIYGVNPIDQEPIHFAVINGKLQEGFAGIPPEQVRSLWVDENSDLYAMVINPEIPGKRTGTIIDENGLSELLELDYLLPMINGQVIDNIGYQPIDYILSVGFYDGKIYGKVFSAGEECFVFGEKICQKIDHSLITELNLCHNFLRSGNATITLEDGRCFQVAQGKIIRSVEEQIVTDFRPINIYDSEQISGPTGFFKFKLGWMLVVNGIIDRSLAEIGSLQLETWEYQADLSPNFKLSFSGVVITQVNSETAPEFEDYLIIDGQDYCTFVENPTVPRRLLSYSKLRYAGSGEAVCQVMVEDGTHILYEQGSFYLPSDCFLVGDLCLPKEHFLEYLCRFDYFDPKELPQISDLDNLRIGYNGEYFCSLKINGIPYLLLGHFLLQQNESMKDFELTVESPGRMQVSFTRDGTLETYGYQHI